MKLTMGQRIKIARIRRQLTQKQLADEIGLSKTSLSQIESGATPNPRMDTLIDLANALHMTLDYLTGRTERDMESEQIPTVPALAGT